MRVCDTLSISFRLCCRKRGLSSLVRARARQMECRKTRFQRVRNWLSTCFDLLATMFSIRFAAGYRIMECGLKVTHQLSNYWFKSYIWDGLFCVTCSWCSRDLSKLLRRTAWVGSVYLNPFCSHALYYSQFIYLFIVAQSPFVRRQLACR